MKNYEITFEEENGDWTWTYIERRDFHDAMLWALEEAADDKRVHSIVFMTPEQIAANKASIAARRGGANV